jgi:hypothetical protein
MRGRRQDDQTGGQKNSAHDGLQITSRMTPKIGIDFRKGIMRRSKMLLRHHSSRAQAAQCRKVRMADI